MTNLLGANLPTGLAAALAAGPPGAPAVLEVDEAWLARVCARTRPQLLVLLNLSRDQLDRNNEVRQVAQRWRDACQQAAPGLVVVANADDPLVAWAASAAPRVTWVGAGLRWNHDAAGCPDCGGPVLFGSGLLGSGPSGPGDGAPAAEAGSRGGGVGGPGGTALSVVFPGRRPTFGSALKVRTAGRSCSPPGSTCPYAWRSPVAATRRMLPWRWPAL